MRGTVPGLINRTPYRTRMPSVYQDDDLLGRMLSAVDEVIAPVIVTVDGLHHYVDPWLAPADFVDMLAAWMGLDLDDHVPLEGRRAAVSGAMNLHRMRGTMRGITEGIQLLVGPSVNVNVADNGGATASSQPGGPLPGSAQAELKVTLTGKVDDAVLARVTEVVRALAPAHIPTSVAWATPPARPTAAAPAPAPEST